MRRADRFPYSQHHKLTFSVLLLAALAAPAIADDFHLASGKVVHGAMVSQSDNQYVIQTEIGTINLAKPDVVRIVSNGTTPVEVQGDIAAKKGDSVAARTAWTQALQQADSGSAAETRLQQKIEELSSTTQQSEANTTLQLLNQAESLLQSQQLDAADTVLIKLRTRVTSDDDALTSRIRQIEARVHYSKGIAARDNVRMDAARQEWEQAISADPTFYPPYMALGNALLDNSASAQRGLRLLREALDIGGTQISEAERYATLYKLAGRYYELKNFAAAAEAYAMLIPARELYPAYADALDKTVDSYVKMGEENMAGDFRQTISTLNSALRLNPQNEKALFLLGRIYLDQGQIENAVVILQRLVEFKPRYPEAQLYLGRAYFKAHDYESAIDHLAAALAVNANSYDALVDRAEAQISIGDYESAKTDLITARAVDENRWIAYYLTALSEFQQDNYDAAQQALMEALQRNPTALPAHLLMGRVLDARNQPDAARKWLEQVVSRLSMESQLSYQYKLYLAEALTRLGEISIRERSPRQAENYLKDALNVAPNYSPALLASADALLLMTNDPFGPPASELYMKAEQLYLRTIELEPKEADHYLKLARFYQQYSHNNTKAQEYFNKYVDAGGRDLNVNIWLAEVGGEPRDEITSAVATAATTAPVFPGTAVTTSTVTATANTTGPALMTTSTVTGVVAPMPGMPVMPQTVVTETSDTEALTSAGQVLNTPAPMPGQTPAPMPGATSAPMPDQAPPPMPGTGPAPMPGAASAPMPENMQ